MRGMALSHSIRIGICVLYAVALILQLGYGKYEHIHHDRPIALAGTVSSDPCQTGHDGVVKHCHTVSIVSLCAPFPAEVASLSQNNLLPSPPRIDNFNGRIVRPQYRPPQIAAS